MTQSAPRVTQRLIREFDRVHDPGLPAAEVCRRLGRRAARLGLPQPSYETVRVLVRWRRARNVATTGEVVLDVMFRTRPPDALLDHVSGVGVHKKR